METMTNNKQGKNINGNKNGQVKNAVTDKARLIAFTPNEAQIMLDLINVANRAVGLKISPECVMMARKFTDVFGVQGSPNPQEVKSEKQN